MRTASKLLNKSDEVRGRALEAAGQATARMRWQARGRARQVRSNLRQAAGKVGDAVRSAS